MREGGLRGWGGGSNLVWVSLLVTGARREARAAAALAWLAPFFSLSPNTDPHALNARAPPLPTLPLAYR